MCAYICIQSSNKCSDYTILCHLLRRFLFLYIYIAQLSYLLTFSLCHTHTQIPLYPLFLYVELSISNFDEFFNFCFFFISILLFSYCVLVFVCCKATFFSFFGPTHSTTFFLIVLRSDRTRHASSAPFPLPPFSLISLIPYFVHLFFELMDPFFKHSFPLFPFFFLMFLLSLSHPPLLSFHIAIDPRFIDLFIQSFCAVFTN